MKNEIPKDILPHLLEISSRLWSSHATIMIGAGFSKNAKGGESATKKFPSWNELGDCFYKKIHGKSPSEKDQCYLNALKLADEVQAAFGRNTLDQILKAEIPDKEYQPSTLHTRTLQLPWTDVFTTNYDTLLERTAEKILQQRYETIVNKEDLILSTKPRIIKLHGSFPSERPFIITEEDYRKYPYEFAPFVNTVQQSLLENTLCLVGFSGDDPNFLKWIGWIRDNLGKDNSPKIYLIGILNLSIGERRLLEERNIIPIDLSSWKGVNGDHEKALTFFVDFLHQQGKVEESLNWPDKDDYYHYDDKKDINEQLKLVIRNWKELRLKYPNWIITPEANRTKLQTSTGYSTTFLYHLQKAELNLDIKFLYELNWRFEKCLEPVYNNWIVDYYEKIIEKYNPFPKFLEIKNAVTIEIDNIEWKTLSKYWIELQLSMLRFYREEGFEEKWNLLADRLNLIITCLSPESLAWLNYERCLFYLFALDITAVKNELNLWVANTSLPYWEAKRAGLLAELGDVVEAERILELSLKSVRSLLNLSPVINDYSAVSQEAYILQLLKYIKNSKNHTKGIYEFNENKDYTDRWNKLIQYKCDPWGELKSFDLYLQKESTDFKTTERKYSFEIGHSSITHNLGGHDKYAEKAYSFLRYIEETGIPFKLPGATFGSDTALKSIAYIANFSPTWAFVSFIRNGDTKVVESIFGRKALSKMNQESVDKLTLKYLFVLENSIDEIVKGSTYRNNNFAISLSTVIPEILSRLCVKCSYEVKLKLLAFLKGVFSSEFRDRYKGIPNLTKWLINSFSNKERYNLLNDLLDFPILDNLHFLVEREFRDPFEFIYIPRNQSKESDKINVDSKKIGDLLLMLAESETIRKTALKRLVVLFDCELLSKDQIDFFGKQLWSKTDDVTGFPSETDYYQFFFITLPHPKEIDPVQLLRNYFSNTSIPIQSQGEKNGIGITGGKIPLFYNIIGTTNSNIAFQWNRNELKALIREMIEWWDADKKYLLEKDDHFFGSVSGEFKARFRHMIKVFSEIIYPNIKLIRKNEINEIGRILNELEEYGMPSLEAKVSFFQVFPKEQKSIIDRIYKFIFSKSDSEILDVINAVIILSEQNYEHIDKLIKYISENIRCRTKTDLDRYIAAIISIFRNHPEYLNKQVLFDLEIGLTYLIDETKIESVDTDQIVHKKLLIKKNAAHLTALIYKYYKENNIEMPDFILKWEELCLDSNEFSEIRNKWLNTI